MGPNSLFRESDPAWISATTDTYILVLPRNSRSGAGRNRPHIRERWHYWGECGAVKEAVLQRICIIHPLHQLNPGQNIRMMGRQRKRNWNKLDEMFTRCTVHKYTQFNSDAQQTRGRSASERVTRESLATWAPKEVKGKFHFQFLSTTTMFASTLRLRPVFSSLLHSKNALRLPASASLFAFRHLSTSRVNQSQSSRFVYLGNLPYRLEIEDIKSKAETFGTLQSINIRKLFCLYFFNWLIRTAIQRTMNLVVQLAMPTLNS